MYADDPAVGRVGERADADRRADHLEDGDAGVERERRILREVVEAQRIPKVTDGVLRADRHRVTLELGELGVDKPLLQRRNNDQIGGEERAADDDEHPDGKPDADAPTERHRSR